MYWIGVTFRVTEPINRIHYYTGLQWSAMFWNELRDIGVQDARKSGLRIIPARMGFRQLHPGERTGVILSVPTEMRVPMQKLFQTWQKRKKLSESNRELFRVGFNLEFEGCRCLSCGDPVNWIEIDERMIEKQVDFLATQQTIRFLFQTPLRLLRPKEQRDPKHSVFDDQWFDARSFLQNIADIGDRKFLTVRKSLIWIDIPHKHALGGVMGGVEITGEWSREILRSIAWGQYLPLGKNASMGLGTYRLAGLYGYPPLNDLPELTTFHDRACDPSFINDTLQKMKDSSPGVDGVTLSMLREESNIVVPTISKALLDGTWKPYPPKRTTLPKPDNTTRQLFLWNIQDRLIHRALAKQLESAVDPLFCAGSMGFRTGKGLQQAQKMAQKLWDNGFRCGIKADIQSCFESIPRESVFLLLQGILPGEPLITLIWLALEESGDALPQGSPISPLLCNVYLHRFDQELRRREIDFVRYGDDFIASRKEGDGVKEIVGNLLNDMGLKLNQPKTRELKDCDQSPFLGKQIGMGCIHPETEPQNHDNEDHSWNSMNEMYHRKGIPVYLTVYQGYASSDGEELVLRRNDEVTRIPWVSVSRLVLIGKCKISASAIRKALYLKIPVVMTSIQGFQVGGFYPNRRLRTASSFARSSETQEKFIHRFSRSLVAAKIHNQYFFLRKNKIKVPELTELSEKATSAETDDSLRGFEGAASALYFKHFRELLEPFPFEKRTYHPPRDAVNAMLSFMYSMLYYRIGESLFSHGIDPWEGLFHQGRGNHMALASDIQEQFRFISDRIVLSLIRRKQINLEQFSEIPWRYGGKTVRMDSDAFRSVLRRFEWTMNEQLTVPGLGQMTYSTLIDMQCRKVKNCLCLGIEYQAFRLQ